MLTFSACYIVKNEEHTLPRSIASLQGICKEIIVVDTGSTDNTMQVAADMGAKVLQFAWENDFSAARNFALSHATGDIILSIDADEYFEPALTQHHVGILQRVVDKGEIVFCVRLVNLGSNGVLGEMHLVRMFCNHKGILYKNAVHEQVNKWERQCFLPDDFTLMHTGYMGDTYEKTVRNMELLRSQLDPETDTAENPVMYFYLSREALQLKEFSEAAKYINKFFDTLKELQFPVHLMIATHRLRLKLALFDAWWEYSGAERAQFVEEYLLAYPTHPIPWMMKGLYAFEYMGDYLQAEECFRQMDHLEEVYDERNFPGDFVSIKNDERLVWLARAAIAAQVGDAGTAFDYYAQILSGGYDQIAMYHMLGCIAGQPLQDCVELLQTLTDLQDPQRLDQLMNSLIYYPEHRDLYVFCAKLQLQQAQVHSDLTAIVSILLGQYAHAIKVGEGIEDNDTMRDALYCTAAFCGGEEALLAGVALSACAKGLVQAYFAGEALGVPDAETLKVLCIVCRQMMFIRNEEALSRFWELFRGQPFLRFLLQSSYFYVGGHFREVLDCYDLDESAFTHLQAAYAFVRTGRAYAGLRLYGEALQQYEKAMMQNRNYHAFARDLHIIASASLEYGPKAQQMITAYSKAEALEIDWEREENEQFLTVRAMFVAPEQGRILMIL